ncbi:MAG: FAD-dependent oxidoreductase [archaeon]
MPADFDVKLLEVIPRSSDVASFRFERPKDFEYKCGQFFFVTVMKDRQALVHHFSFSSSPTEQSHIEFTTVLRDSEFKRTLRSMSLGDIAGVKGPYGRFTLDNSLDRIAMITSGIGITPLRSICRYCADWGLLKDIVLLYGNGNEEQVLFREELEVIQDLNRQVRVVNILNNPTPDWKSSRGSIEPRLVQEEIPDFMERTFYLCGPPAVVEATQDVLKTLNVPKDQTRIERFPGYE